jgi:hypothetical protein
MRRPSVASRPPQLTLLIGMLTTDLDEPGPDRARAIHRARAGGTDDGRRIWTPLILLLILLRITRSDGRSGDGPLSVRVRPSSLKRDGDRRATSTAEECPAQVHAMSRLTLEPDTPVRRQGPGRSLPGPDASHPLHSAGNHRARSTVKTCNRPSRDIRGMILDDAEGGHAESPGSSSDGQ